MDSTRLLGTSPPPYIQRSPKEHLLSSIVIVIWCFFIVFTVIVFEQAHYTTWNLNRILDGEGIPWIYRPGLGLPSILRTIFTQFHGPITAMHLARLSVNALDVSWASPRTWMELFWLVDRRWSGPVGLVQTGWTLISRWRPRVSLTFWLFAMLSIVALVTPVFMARAYGVATDDILRNITATDVLVFERTPETDGLLRNAQQKGAYSLWGYGTPATVLFPKNAYSELGVIPSQSNGTWFFTGDSRKSEMSLSGIRVSGGCEAWRTTKFEAESFGERCIAEFGPGMELNPIQDVARNITYGNSYTITYSLITHRWSCSNIGLETAFGRGSQSSVLFRMWFELEDGSAIEDDIVRCNATAGAGTASVDGFSMTFSQFSEVASSINETELSPLDPVAAIMRSDMLSFQQSVAFKRPSTKVNDDELSREDAMAAAAWDGLLAMSAELWLKSSRRIDQPGIQRFPTTGIRRRTTSCYIFIALLGVWFIGMFAATVALLSPAWTSTLDGYAVARILHSQPVISGTEEVWFSELEENPDLLKQFRMH